MRILMLDNEFPPLGGGTGVVNFHILKEMEKYPEISIDLVTSSRTKQKYETDTFAERIMIYKVPVNNQNIHHASNRELLLYTWRGFQLCRKLLTTRKYDLSFAFAGVPAGGISYALKKIFKLPYLVSLQGPDVPGFEARYNYLYPFLKPVLRRIWGNAAIVTAISREHKDLARQTMPAIEIPIIYNGVDTEKFHPNPKPKAFFNILCVGRLIERKGQHHLLQALARLQQQSATPFQLTLIGTGDAEDALRSLAVELGVNDRVLFKGFIPQAQMPTEYQEADVFVLPSQNEGMSIALLEAMSSGLPVIVTKTGGTDELVTEGVNGYIVSWANVDELAAVLEKLRKSKESLHKLGMNSRNIAKKFGWPEVTAEYIELCETIASSDIR